MKPNSQKVVKKAQLPKEPVKKVAEQAVQESKEEYEEAPSKTKVAET